MKERKVRKYKVKEKKKKQTEKKIEQVKIAIKEEFLIQKLHNYKNEDDDKEVEK